MSASRETVVAGCLAWATVLGLLIARGACLAGEPALGTGGVSSLEDALRGLAPSGVSQTRSDRDTPADGTARNRSGAAEAGRRAFSPGALGSGKTQFFGIEATGYKVVYVFDRSGSMGGDGPTSLAAVKVELATSLEGLQRTQQFQIIFYNHAPLQFNPSGYRGRLAFATDSNKQRALRFMDTVVADGGTDHLLALKAAIGLRPDVVFFLTDADDPQLTEAQLADVRRWAAGTVISTIEFGQGPNPGQDNFLRRLARENGGKHVYVDAATLPNE